MSRKKVTKTTAAKGKKISAKQTIKTKTTATLTTNLERDFRDIPAKLAAQCKKEWTALAQQEKKLKSELKKAQAQKKSGKKQQLVLTAKSKKNPTAASKKQLAAMKQTQDKNTKAITALATELAQIKQQTKAASQQQAKFAALNKHIAQFEKSWAQKTRKAAKPATATRKRAAKKTAPTPIQDNTSTHEMTTILSPVREVEIAE